MLWVGIASVVGLLCFVLPPYLIPGALAKRAYGQPLIPWLATAYANVQFWPTTISLFFLGFGLGWAQPHSWKLLAWSTVALTAILHAANILHDILRNPKTHNLLPFEFIIFLIIAVGALAGGFIGFRINQLRH